MAKLAAANGVPGPESAEHGAIVARGAVILSEVKDLLLTAEGEKQILRFAQNDMV